ncbi:hypothetical protein T4B_15193 [Trichinella pseudospiralis]|uniref:Uncharacterized protein n=1 Tax=Trichinella pseudospiralis TaxID=6337 RepID=A0A0V1I9Q1_TRIPS|nr:hypothetical protein T4B_15193 [Trichinella pseudospiralis]
MLTTVLLRTSRYHWIAQIKLTFVKNFCLLNVMKGMHSKTCLPENVCKFLFHCYTCAYVASGSTVVDVCNTANRTFPKLQDLARNTPFFKNKGNAKSFSSFGQTLPPLHLEAGK